MPTIIFTDNPKPTSEAVRANGWRKGSVAELSLESCERWIKRGVAKYHAVKVEAPPAATEAAAPAPGNVTLAFDPTTADLADVRAYLAEHNVTPGPRTSEAKLRETALEILTRA